MGCRTSFVRQGANLLGILDKIQCVLAEKLSKDKDLFLFDGFPIPLCHVKRHKKSSPFAGQGAIGYCASKDEKYFGFKGNLMVTAEGATRAFAIAPANVDERDVLPELASAIESGDIIADKGLIRPELSQSLKNQGITLHTPLRKNMKDSRPKEFVESIMNVRRRIETVIGQLVERFKIQSIRAKDSWHLMAKITRKILAHTFCFFINKSINPQTPLQLEALLDF